MAFIASVGKSHAQAFKSSEGVVPESSSAASVSLPQGASISGPTESARAILSISETTQSDSATGWSSFLTPDLGFRFNPYFFVDSNLPWYLLVEASVPTTVNGVTTNQIQSRNNVIGDAAASAHFEPSHNNVGYKGVATVAFPTGDKTLGVGAGTTTYHFNNHVEYSIGRFNPDLEAGIGNSSALANPLVKKSYTAVGAIANFQAGVDVDLPRKVALDLQFYEAMPLAIQSLFGTIGQKSAKSGGRSKQVYQGTNGNAEDNGITVEVGVPISRSLTLSGNYNRSLIQDGQIVGFSLAWSLHPKTDEAIGPVSPVSR
jgi:hypothetical protein